MAKKKRYRARVRVMPRPAVLDPQGKAIRDALSRLGFKSVTEVRAGKSFVIDFSSSSEGAAGKQLDKMCDKLLANTLVEDYAIELIEEVKP